MKLKQNKNRTKQWRLHIRRKLEVDSYSSDESQIASDKVYIITDFISSSHESWNTAVLKVAKLVR